MLQLASFFSLHIGTRLVNHLALICLLCFGSVAAQANKISRSVFPLIMEIQNAISPEADKQGNIPDVDFAFVRSKIEALLEKELSDYEASLAYQFSANVFLQTEDYTSAYKDLLKVHELNQLEPNKLLSIERTLAQLALNNGEYQASADFYSSWMRQVAKEKISEQDYLALSQAYLQLEQWHNAVPSIDLAIQTRVVHVEASNQKKMAEYQAKKDAQKEATNKGDSAKVSAPTLESLIAPEGWYRSKLSALLNEHQRRINAKEKRGKKTSVSELEAQAIDVSKLLVVHYPKLDYWRQLAALYQQASLSKAKGKDYPHALSALHSAYVSGLLITEKDLAWMIQLMMQQANYHQAGRVLTRAMDQQHLPESFDYLRLLSTAWVMAKEYQRAEQVLSRQVQKFPQDSQAKERLELVQKLLKNRV